MIVRRIGAIVFLCLMCCLSASARIEAFFRLDEAVQKATHIVIVEARSDGFRVVESWAGDLAPGAVLDCLDLFCVDAAQYARVVAEEQRPYHGAPVLEGEHPVLADGLVFVPEGAKVILFLREIRGDSAPAIPTAELLPAKKRRFACVSHMWPCMVTSLAWCPEEDVYYFGTIWSDGPQWLQPMHSQEKGNGGRRLPLKVGELKKLVASRQGKGEPVEGVAQAGTRVEWFTRANRLMKARQFKDIKLRLFRDGEAAGAGYEMVTGQIIGARVTLPAQTVPDGGVLLCVPDDQTDPVVAEGLSSYVRLWTSKEQARLNARDFSDHVKPDAQILDALGEPIQGASVSLAMQTGYQDSATEPVLLCERMTDENGRVELLALPAEPGEGAPVWHYVPFEIAHPDYGMTRVRYHPNAVNSDGKMRASLVREGTKARERALRGVVVDPDAKPVCGAVVSSGAIRPPGLLINGPCLSVTDEEGCFYLYPAEQMRPPGQSEIGTDLVPLRSKYSYHVLPPEGSGLRVAQGWALNSEPVTIALESEEAFVARGSVHSFKFEGGFPEGAGHDAGIWVAIRGDAGFGVNLIAPDEEHRIPHGTYYGHIESRQGGSETVNFAPLVVSAESPKELAFQKTRASCAGQVIDGVTGEPVAGVLCLVGSKSWIPLRLTFDDVPELLRQALAQDGASQEDIEGVAEALGRDFPLLAAAVTDKDGRYDVAAPPGRRTRLVYAIAEGRVPTARHVYTGNPTDSKRFDLDPIPLYPAAQAKVRVGGDIEGECLVIWQADEAATGDWAVPLRGYYDSVRHSLEITGGRFDPSEGDATFLIPANAPLHLVVNPPDAGLIPIRMDEALRAEPGQLVDLGEVRFAKGYSVPVTVHVVDEQGNPVEGVPIRKLSGNCWSFPSLTDEKGTARFDVSPGITEKVGVSPIRAGLSFAVEPDLDDSDQIEHTFTLTEEQFKKIVGRAGPH